MAPEATFFNEMDRSDFMKFTKFFALRGVQVIVLARRGEKVETSYKKPSNETDWFNISIPDAPDVSKATKAAFLGDIVETFENHLCVEVSLKTSEGDEMVLETWSFHLDRKATPDHTMKAMSTLYQKLSTLLKSLISTTRVEPAYKLSRRQSPDSYSIYYQVYTGQPKKECLGQNYQEKVIGSLKTPLGEISITSRTRSNMIMPKKQKSDLLLKSDHFELSPKHIISDQNKNQVKQKVESDLTKPLRGVAFADADMLEDVIASYHELMPKQKSRSPATSVSRPQEVAEVREKSPTPAETPPKRYWFRSEKDHPLQLLQCPFADRQPIRELAEFYRDFFNAPQLKSLQETQDEVREPEKPLQEEPDLSRELEEFENSAHEFDEMIASMYHVDGNN